MEAALASGDLEDEWLTVIGGWLKVDVGAVYNKIDVWECISFSLDTRDDFIFFVVLGVSEGGEENEWFLDIADNEREKLDCVESLSLYEIYGS